MNLEPNSRPSAKKLLLMLDKLESVQYGSTNSKTQYNELVQTSSKQYVTYYPKNPNQNKKNPEFFSKKIAEKL